LVARSVVIRNTVAFQADLGGGLQASLGALVEIERAVFERNQSTGLLASDLGTEVRASEVSVRSTIAMESGGLLIGAGVTAQYGARVELRESSVDGSGSDGLAVYQSGAELVATDVVVTGTSPTNQDSFAIMVRGGQAELVRVMGEGNATGVGADSGSALTATDLVIRDSTGQIDGRSGYGLEVVHGELTRAAFLRNRNFGLANAGREGSLRAVDITVRGTRAELASGEAGYGVGAAFGVHLELLRVESVGNEMSGIFASNEAWVTGSDVRVEGTLPQAATGQRGDGIHVQVDSRAELSRLAVNGNHSYGVVVAFGSTGRFEDLLVGDTREQACAVDSCAGLAGGFGIAAIEGSLSADRFRVEQSALCGIQVAEEGELDLHHGVVSNNPIGANVQAEGYDLARLQDDVFYLDNERNFDSQDLPLPEAFETLPPVP
jgi:hypothetical protein